MYAYDDASRLCRVIENADTDLDLSPLTDPCTDSLPSGHVTTTSTNLDTQYGYDADGNLASQYSAGVPAAGDPAGKTTYVYDALDRLTSVTDPDGNVVGANPDEHKTTYTYDAAGIKASETDPDGQKIYWFYDHAERLCRRLAFAPNASITLPSAPCEAPSGPVSGAAVDTYYAYDDDSNRTVAKDVVTGVTISSTYDGLARPTDVNQGTTHYTYGLGSLARTDPSGSYTFALDADGRQSDLQVTPGGASSALAYSWSYSLTGATASITDPTGNVTSYGHDSLGRLTSQSTTGATACSNCVVLTYTHNAAGNKVSSTASYDGGAATSTTYAYDALSRITGYTPPAPTPTQTYAWNATPDRTSIQIGTNDPVTTAYDAASRPVTDASHASDANGRVTKLPGAQSGEVLTLAWDPLGRLTSVTSSLGGVATYTYDALDRLASTTVGEVTTDFSYVGLSDALAKVTTGSTVVEIGCDRDGSALFEYDPVSGLPTYLGHNDHGDTAFTTGSTGALAAQATYDPFGNVSGSIPAGIRWQGSWRDSASGLYYVVARWYDPVSGAFLAQDPVTQDPDAPQTRDPYAYAAGDPVNSIDPDGRLPVTLLASGVVGNFHEPYTSDYDGNWGLCQSGALRVVLSFTSWAKGWKLVSSSWGTWKGVWPTSSYPDLHTGKTAKRDPNGDLYGQNYMLYLGYSVLAPDMKQRGLRWAGSHMPTDAALIANWEIQGEPTNSRGTPIWQGPKPFTAKKWNTSEATFKSDVIASIIWGVPVWMAVRTASLKTDIGLPSWYLAGSPASWYNLTLPNGKKSDYHSLSYALNKKTGKWEKTDLGHAVAIIGYDNDNFYYVDTCARGSFGTTYVGCRKGPIDDDTRHGAQKQSGYAHLWKISQHWMYTLMNEWTGAGAYVAFNPSGYNGKPYLHAAW